MRGNHNQSAVSTACCQVASPPKSKTFNRRAKRGVRKLTETVGPAGLGINGEGEENNLVLMGIAISPKLPGSRPSWEVVGNQEGRPLLLTGHGCKPSHSSLWKAVRAALACRPDWLKDKEPTRVARVGGASYSDWPLAEKSR